MNGDFRSSVLHTLEILVTAAFAVAFLLIFKAPITNLLDKLIASESVVAAIEMAAVGALTALGGFLLKYRRTKIENTDYVNE